MSIRRTPTLFAAIATALALASTSVLADPHAHPGGFTSGGHVAPVHSPGLSGQSHATFTPPPTPHVRFTPPPASHVSYPRWGGVAHESQDHGHWEHDPHQGGGHGDHGGGHQHGNPGGGRQGDHDGGHWHGDDDGDRFASSGRWHHEWGDGDIWRFRDHDHDWDDWHHGGWHHEWHDGVFAWWFVVSGVWFWYPVPVYPYPDPYVPPTFIAPPPPDAAPASTDQYWYYCPARNGYYPYVPSCPSGWQQVPATPDDAGQPSDGDDNTPPDDGDDQAPPDDGGDDGDTGDGGAAAAEARVR